MVVMRLGEAYEVPVDRSEGEQTLFEQPLQEILEQVERELAKGGNSMTEEQAAALVRNEEKMAQPGKYWKAAVADAWETANDGSIFITRKDAPYGQMCVHASGEC